MKRSNNVQVVRYNTDIKNGLSNEQIKERIDSKLTNDVKTKYSKSYFMIVVNNLCTFFNLLGLLCLIALLTVGAKTSNFFFVAIYLANILIGIIQEVRAKKSVDKLSIITAKSTKVIRNGTEINISNKDILLDDVIIFSLGNQISADSIILDGNIEVNESMLTGESVPVKKTVGDVLYAGSFVVGGNAIARADKIGQDKYIETLSAKAKKYKRPHSELMSSLKWIIKIVGILIVPMAVLQYLKTHDVIATSGVILGMIPAGLMLLTSVALAVGVIRLAKNHTLVNDLYSLEMLARVDTLCLDKTGTITDGQMIVENIINLKDNFDLEKSITATLNALDDKNQTAIALKKYFKNDYSLEVIQKIPFNSARKLSGASFKGFGTVIIGAPEFVFSNLDSNITNQINDFTKKGLRVLVVGYTKEESTEGIPNSLEPVALIILADNIREDAIPTINWFKENKVNVKVISGDNPITVSEIAKKVGIINAENYISLDGLTDEEVIASANKYTVFGRVSPEQKALLIKAMKNEGHTVAMTGDGINDIIAMKESDCAITVASGAEAARNVAHIVLMDNNFNSMPKVVFEGRRVINNIQSSASLYLMKTIFITIMALIVLFIPNYDFPFKPGRMVFFEVFVTSMPSFFLSLQANKNLVEGRFIKNVLAKSLPASLTLIFGVIVMLIYGFVNHNNGTHLDVFNTSLIYALCLVGLVTLFGVCRPFNKFRMAVFGISAIVVSIWAILTMFLGHHLLDELVALKPLFLFKGTIICLFITLIASIPVSWGLTLLCRKIKNVNFKLPKLKIKTK